MKLRSRSIILCLSCLICGLVLFGCAPKTEDSGTPAMDTQVPDEQPTETDAVEIQPTETEVSDQPTLAPIVKPTEEVVEIVPVEPEVNECINCHSDKQRLIDTAKPEEVVESEDEGEG